MSKKSYLHIANILANRLIQANETNNYERLVEINEIIFHLGESFEFSDKKFKKTMWRDYIDMIAYGKEMKDKKYYG